MVKTRVDDVYGTERAHLKAAFRRETSQIRCAFTACLTVPERILPPREVKLHGIFIW